MARTSASSVGNCDLGSRNRTSQLFAAKSSSHTLHTTASSGWVVLGNYAVYICLYELCMHMLALHVCTVRFARYMQPWTLTLVIHTQISRVDELVR